MRIDVFVRDRFGEEVAELLKDSFNVEVHLWEQIWFPETWRRESVIVPISGVSILDAERFINETCVPSRRAYCAIVLEARHLRVGPLRTVGTDGCFWCFHTRQWQHKALTQTDDFIETTRKLNMGFTREAFGHLPSHVLLARELLARALENLDGAADLEPAGNSDSWPRVFKAGLAYTHIEEFSVVPVNNCSTCSSTHDGSSSSEQTHDLEALSMRLRA
ncbi:hypothetical protein ICM05_05410 [Leucobacter sp. cx-42]|uniref:hypothetical protein n=1 Tax=unclassified Leucobacter TaxID=2621730 RepID=UPI00165E655B|nr:MULTISPECIES: hypothetical protein [unclassified Leucobacter]MBC9954083.1 hypothetical protein [Leucobacter sp. cx-42]